MTLRADGTVLFNARLASMPGIGHAISTRKGGVSTGLYSSLNLAGRPDEPVEHVTENRRLLCERIGAPPERLTHCKQLLGAEVAIAHAGERPEADALVTNERGLPILTFSADCNLTILVDPKRGVIGNAHASRPGARGEIARRTVDAMRERFASDPSDIVALVGPSIGPCCYTLRDDVAADWKSFAPQHLRERDGRVHLDLKAAVRAQLVAAGVPESSIETSELCTQCRDDWFYSYRRDGENTGRFGAVIWLR